MSVPAPYIVTCAQWGARPPKKTPRTVAHGGKALLHHTAGHHAEITLPGDESLVELIRYAQTVQRVHMDVNGWNDSGHNFLVGRSGRILQGRWGTVTAIEHGRMVESAHCPGANDCPGVEFEHYGSEPITYAQEAAGITLYAWIFDRLGIAPYQLFGHKDFYNTECPSVLYPYTRSWRVPIVQVINAHGRGSAPHGGVWRANRAVRREIRG